MSSYSNQVTSVIKLQNYLVTLDSILQHMFLISTDTAAHQALFEALKQWNAAYTVTPSGMSGVEKGCRQ
jgi:hypothetical protein